MDKERLKKISDELGVSFEEAQNTMQMESMAQLLKFGKSRNWTNQQRTNIPLLSKRLDKIAQQEEKRIIVEYTKAMTKVYEDTGVKGSSINKQSLDEKTGKITIEVKEMVNGLLYQIKNQHNQMINNIQNRIELVPLNETNKIYDEICKVVQKEGGVENEPKVMYSNGRRVSWKSYMEMKARTTLSTENTNQMIEAGASLGVVFYLCDTYGDSEKIHADLQGKIYYDNRYLQFGLKQEYIDKIEQYISSNNLMSIQQVRDAPYYLETRPNCRHKMHPIGIEDVLGGTSVSQMLKENNYEKNGKYEEEKAVARETQRLIERKIRQCKSEINKYKQIIGNAPKGTNVSLYETELQKATRKKTQYQKKIRSLIEKNNFLERQSRRESIGIVAEDLGASKK